MSICNLIKSLMKKFAKDEEPLSTPLPAEVAEIWERGNEEVIDS